MRNTTILLCVLFLAPGTIAAKTDSLKYKLNKIISEYQAKAGIVVRSMDAADSLEIHPEDRFPMQSVFKFPLVLAVLKQVDEGRLSMDQPVEISKEDFFPTWSPIMKKYPEGAAIPLKEVLMHTASESDNVACDVLFRLIGGPEIVNDYMHSIGVTGISIKNTEREIHQGWDVQFDNWCTPRAMGKLLRKFYHGQILSESSRAFLWEAMVNAIVGKKRLKGMLPEGVEVAHRPGTSNVNAEGIFGAINDVGIISLPNNKKVMVVVFVTEAKGNMGEIEMLIARVARAVYDDYQ